MKRLSKVVLSLVLLVVFALTMVVLFVSPNQFKPVLVKLAKEQGIALELGNMGWTLWPRLGISLADVSVAPLASPAAPLATFSDAGLMLAIKPLFKGEFEVDYLRLTNANIRLVRDSNGVGNWETLLQETPPLPEEEDLNSEPSKPLQLAVERIALLNATLSYDDQASGSAFAVSELNLDANDVNTQARAFPMTLSLTASIKDGQTAKPQLVSLNMSHSMRLNADFSQLNVFEGRLDLEYTHQTDADASLSYSADVKNLQEALSYSGSLDLKSVNARHWLQAMGAEIEMADAKALNSVALTTQFVGDLDAIALNDLRIKLDSTNIEGQLAVNSFSSPKINTVLSIDKINADHYLSPATETQEASTSNSDDVALPLETLRELNVTAKVTLAQLVIKDLLLSTTDFSFSIANGKFNQALKTHAYEGDLLFDSSGNFSAKQAAVSFEGAANKIEIAPIMAAQSLNEKWSLSGALNAAFDGSVKGATVNQLIDSMAMVAKFNGADIRLAPLNIEQRVCQAVNLIAEQTLHEVQWDAFTEMRELTGELIWKDQKITLNNVNAGVSQLLVSGVGVVDLKQSEFDISLPIRILTASETAQASHCSLSTELEWLNRSLNLLRCSGNFNELNLAKDCGLDKSALAELTRDYAAFKIKEKHGDKIQAVEEKIDQEKQKLNEKVSEKLGLEAGEDVNVKSALTGLLKKRLGTASSAEASAANEDSSADASIDAVEDAGSNE